MILYSIMPSEVVFSGNQETQGAAVMEMEYLGEKVEVSPASDNSYTIQRLISTSPKAYLNPKLQPGTVIRRV